MVLIILSWMYILFTTINLGFGLDKIMKFKNDDFCITVFLGLFTTTIFTTIWALFGRINIEFHAVLLVANTIIFFKYQTEIKEKYFLFWKSITELSIALKWLLFLISFLIIAQCAAAPYIIDNESYYIQTIKWINEYGFVKGLANLHIFFGQTSGWHIAQSAFNFSFIYKNFNDLSGFCLLIGTVFSIFKLDKFFSNSDKNYLIIGLIPLANVFFFQFISAPSPDIPVYILTFIIFFYVLNNFKNIQISDYNLITTLVLFTLFIKTTAIALLLFPLVLFIFNFKKIVRNLVPIGFLGALVFILFIIKNTIITGYPFFPTRTFGLMNLDFGVPQNVISFYFNETKLYGFFLTKEEFHSMSFLEIFIKWLLSSKINSFFNILTVLILSVTPYFIYKYQNKKAVWFVYFVVIIQFIILLITSPQYRFFIHLTLFFSFLIFASLFHQRKIILFFYTISVLITCVVLFIPMEFNALTSNKFISKNSSFTCQSILIPHNNSKTITAYSTVSKGNLKYYSPIENSFFWGTGNGNLPCVNKEQLDYFEKYLLVYPQQRTTNLKDGFYAKKIINSNKID